VLTIHCFLFVPFFFFFILLLLHFPSFPPPFSSSSSSFFLFSSLALPGIDGLDHACQPFLAQQSDADILDARCRLLVDRQRAVHAAELLLRLPDIHVPSATGAYHVGTVGVNVFDQVGGFSTIMVTETDCAPVSFFRHGNPVAPGAWGFTVVDGNGAAPDSAWFHASLLSFRRRDVGPL
jgi:hypothetical protein